MSSNRYVQLLTESCFRELGYFSGLQVFLGVDMLITIDHQGSGFVITVDSVARNIGFVEYVCNDFQLCQVIEGVLG